MAEVFDEYVDQSVVAATAYGISLTFRRSSPTPPTPGNVPSSQEVGTLRMSMEHFKVMAYLMKRQVDEIEGQIGYEIQMPMQFLAAMKIPPEDWQKFWKRSQ